MTTAEITAYLYGAKLARQAQALMEAGRGDVMPQSAWMGPDEFTAIERIGLRRFNYWMQEGGRDALNGRQEA